MLEERERVRQATVSSPPLPINVLLFAITQVARLGQREEKQKKKKKKKRRRKKQGTKQRPRWNGTGLPLPK